jgi:hypothetical protein
MLIGKGPPQDRTVREDEIKSVTVGIVAFLSVLAALGIIMAVLFLAVNIFYREKRSVRKRSKKAVNFSHN